MNSMNKNEGIERIKKSVLSKFGEKSIEICEKSVSRCGLFGYYEIKIPKEILKK